MNYRNRYRNQRGAIYLSALLAVSLASVGAAGALVINEGVIRVHVQEKHEGGENIHIIVPAAIVPLGLAFVPEKQWQRAAREIRMAAPILQAVAAELYRLPDTVFVEVRDGDTHVLVQKIGSSIVVDVDSDDETVHVSFPIRTLFRVANRFKSIKPDPDEAAEWDSEEDFDASF